MLRLQKIYTSPLTETAPLTQMVLLVMGLVFFLPQTLLPLCFPFFCVRVSVSFSAFSLSGGHTFLPPKGRLIRVSDLSLVLLHTLFTHFCYSLSLLTPISLWILPSTPGFNTFSNQQTPVFDFLLSYLFSFMLLLCWHLPSLDIKKRSGNMGKTFMSFLKCKTVPVYS